MHRHHLILGLRLTNDARRRALLSLLCLALALASMMGSMAPASAKPVLTYGTFLTSSGYSDATRASVVDADGNVYVVGSVDGSGFPTTPGAFLTEAPGGADGFLAKFDAAGELVFSTYLGGSHHEGIEEVALAPDGSIYVSGATLSEDLPVTPDALQPEWRGNVSECEFACFGDGFVARFSPDGSELLYSTFLGGELGELADEIVVDDQGRVYVSGYTTSPDFPVTPGAFDETYNTPTCFDQCDADAFVARLSADGSALDFATFYGGTSWDSVGGLDLDAAGNIYIGGATRSTDLATSSGSLQPEKMGNGDFDFSGFVAAFSPDASELLYGTYLGKRAEDQVTELTAEPDGTAWVTGFAGRGLPITEDALQPFGRIVDGFAVGIAPDGAAAEYGSYLGAEREDYGRGIAIDERGRVLVVGSTASQNLQTRRATQRRNGGMEDLFFVRFRPGASAPHTLTYLGGRSFETSTGFSSGPGGTVYLTGSSESTDMPLGGDFLQGDRAHSDGVLLRLQGSGLVSSVVRAGGIEKRRLVIPLSRATLRWRNATDGPRSLVETAVHLFASRRRVPGSHYYFSFPAGRFVVADRRSDAVQRIGVAPQAVAGEGTTVEVRWARNPLPPDFVFDVKVSVDGGPYEMWQEETTDTRGTFAGAGVSRSFRVRVSNLTTGETSAWSPATRIDEGG